ncbi:hypothetical protein PG984_009960 [Apiospora sp. TS-2023a]
MPKPNLLASPASQRTDHCYVTKDWSLLLGEVERLLPYLLLNRWYRELLLFRLGLDKRVLRPHQVIGKVVIGVLHLGKLFISGIPSVAKFRDGLSHRFLTRIGLVKPETEQTAFLFRVGLGPVELATEFTELLLGGQSTFGHIGQVVHEGKVACLCPHRSEFHRLEVGYQTLLLFPDALRVLEVILLHLDQILS